MTLPECTGALEGLKIVDRDHLDRYKAAVAAGNQIGWGYYFPNLLAQNRPGRSAILVIEDEGSLCVFRWRLRDAVPRLELYLPPIPLSISVLRRCLERANTFNADRSARIVRIDARDAEAMSGVPGLRVRPRATQYVFAPGAYEDLGGQAYRTIRRNVALFEGRTDVEVAPFSAAHAEGCRALLARWKTAHREAHGTAGGVGTSSRAIEWAGTLPAADLGGEVVLLDGRLSGYALGGEIRPGWACAFDRKCDNDVRGLTYFQFRSFLLSLRGFERVNDGSDAGRPGLRQLKDSFRPVEMHAEYRATQEGRLTA